MTRQMLTRLSLIVMALLLLSTSCWAQGDPQRGEALYVGSTSFSAGGAPCLACHGIAGHELGYASGANYGPDLTMMYEDYGDDGVAAVLEDLSFEGMEAIYASRPLTETEMSDLVAFFAETAADEAVSIGSGMTLHVVIVTVIFFIIFGAFGWRRLQGVRQPLVEQSQRGKGESA